MFVSIRTKVVLLIAFLLATMSFITAQPAQAATVSCTSSTPVAARPLVRRGDNGSCVTELQKRLNTRGARLVTDGRYGGGTYAALTAYQRSRGLTPDGIAGRATWSALLGSTPVTPTPTPKPTPAPSQTGWSISKGPNRSSKVMLTFDDCAPSVARFREVILEAERLGISIVVLPYGQCRTVDANFALAHGQMVAGHSVTHPQLTKLSRAGLIREIDGVSRRSGVLRPPYGAYNSTVRSVMASQGIRLWTWTVDTNDWRGKSRTQVVSYVIGNSAQGSTVLMHMNHAAFNAQSIREMKSGLNRRGLQVCSINAGRQVAKAGGRIPDRLAC